MNHLKVEERKLRRVSKIVKEAEKSCWLVFSTVCVFGIWVSVYVHMYVRMLLLAGWMDGRVDGGVEKARTFTYQPRRREGGGGGSRRWVVVCPGGPGFWTHAAFLSCRKTEVFDPFGTTPLFSDDDDGGGLSPPALFFEPTSALLQSSASNSPLQIQEFKLKGKNPNFNVAARLFLSMVDLMWRWMVDGGGIAWGGLEHGRKTKKSSHHH